MSKGIFGKVFDFNGDGNLNAAEQAAEFAFLEELTKEESEEDSGLSITVDISIGSDADEDDEWRDKYYGDDSGVEPDEYDTEEEYLEAVEEKRIWIDGISEKIIALAEEYDVEPEDYDSYDEFIEALKEEMG